MSEQTSGRTTSRAGGTSWLRATKSFSPVTEATS